MFGRICMEVDLCLYYASNRIGLRAKLSTLQSKNPKVWFANPKVLLANPKALLPNPKVLLANQKALLAVERNLVGAGPTPKDVRHGSIGQSRTE